MLSQTVPQTLPLLRLRAVLITPNFRSKIWNFHSEKNTALCKRFAAIFFFAHSHRLHAPTTMERTSHPRTSELHQAHPTLTLPHRCRISCCTAKRPATRSSQAMDADTTLLFSLRKPPKKHTILHSRVRTLRRGRAVWRSKNLTRTPFVICR